MRYTALTQILLIVVSVIIIYTFIQPRFVTIGMMQDEVAEYQETVKNAGEFNAILSGLLAEERAIPDQDRLALEAFLPNEMDPLSVMADITTIVENNGAYVTELSEGISENQQGEVVVDDEGAVPALRNYNSHEFMLSMVSDYQTLKAVLLDFERNKYLLEIASLTFGDTEGASSGSSGEVEGVSGFSVEITLRAYSLTPAVAST